MSLTRDNICAKNISLVSISLALNWSWVSGQKLADYLYNPQLPHVWICIVKLKQFRNSWLCINTCLYLLCY